jgi:hypothetical protein
VNRQQLEEAIARACEIVAQPRVIVIGSQAILASYDFEQLPRTATMSMEADIAPEVDIDDYLSGRLWVLAGQDSDWANERDYFIDAVSANTAILPDGWRARSIEVTVPESPGLSGLCPEAHDLCASKMARGEPKDREFVQALSGAGLVNPQLLRNRLDEISDPRLEPDRKRVARQFVIWLEQERRRSRGAQ